MSFPSSSIGTTPRDLDTAAEKARREQVWDGVVEAVHQTVTTGTCRQFQGLAGLLTALNALAEATAVMLGAPPGHTADN